MKREEIDDDGDVREVEVREKRREWEGIEIKAM